MAVILTAVAALGGITVILAALLILANKKLYVQEDPRIDVVEEMLPHANCGACGFPGCRPFAEALVGGQALPGKCTVSSEEGRVQIAHFLGVDVGAQEKVVARLACAGGINVARNRARYEGLKTCRAAAVVAGGGKGCFWGCLGLADCEVVCDFDAIHMNQFSLPVVDEEKCTACGDCVEVCPKDLFSLHRQPPPVGGLQKLRSRRRNFGRLRSGLHRLRALRRGRAGHDQNGQQPAGGRLQQKS